MCNVGRHFGHMPHTHTHLNDIKDLENPLDSYNFNIAYCCVYMLYSMDTTMAAHNRPHKLVAPNTKLC